MRTALDPAVQKENPQEPQQSSQAWVAPAALSAAAMASPSCVHLACKVASWDLAASQAASEAAI